ncbi:response regulator [Candidatus Woesearchaeota archaeon]|nr:response regulator [Candidatus Woesearchaeota archaeon]
MAKAYLSTIKMADKESLEGKLKVLIVDDDELVKGFLGVVANRAGANATLAADGQEGISQYVRMDEAGTPYDVVLTDLSMPKKDGLDVTEAVKRINPSALIYVITGGESDERYRRRLEALKSMEPGPTGIIMKPFGPLQMISFIQALHSYVRNGKAGSLPQYIQETSQS